VLHIYFSNKTKAVTLLHPSKKLILLVAKVGGLKFFLRVSAMVIPTVKFLFSQTPSYEVSGYFSEFPQIHFCNKLMSFRLIGIIFAISIN